MKRSITILLTLMLFVSHIHSQVDIERFLISPWGASSNSWSATAGETSIGFMSGQADLLVGFQQPSSKSVISFGQLHLDLSVYPNPTMDWINIELSNTVKEPLTVLLISPIGYKITSTILQQGQVSTRINLGGISPGFYTLVIYDLNGNLISSLNMQKI